MADGRNGTAWLRRGARSLALMTTAAVAVMAVSVGFGVVEGHAASADEAVGLVGILPDEVPDGLLEADFEDLPESWQEWGKATAAEIASLYDPKLDVAGQQAVVEALEKRVNSLETALGDPRYAAIHGELTTIRGRLSRRVDVAGAILKTLSLDPADAHAERIAEARSAVVTAAKSLETELNTLRGGSSWFTYANGPKLLTLGDEATDGAALKPVLKDTVESIAKGAMLEDEAQKAFLGKKEFTQLAAAALAFHDIVGTDPPKVDLTGQRKTMTELVAALEAYESDNTSVAATKVRGLLKSLESSTADGAGSLWAAVLENYLNFNLRFVAGEKFVAKLTSEQMIEDGDVNDYLMGTRIRGKQTTTTTVAIDLKANDGEAEFDVVLDGSIRSRTTGYNARATVFTSGNHSFAARKAITFDGESFEVAPATISVRANNNTYAARAKVSPLFAGIGNRIAVREARKRRGQSNAHTRKRVTERVLPQFNEQADEDFDELNEDFGNLNARLAEKGLVPNSKKYRTTDELLLMHARVGNDGELGGGKAPIETAAADEATFYLHESLLNNSLDRLGLAGQTLTETELLVKLSEFASVVAGREVKLDAPEEDDGAKFVFAKADPLRVQIGEGTINVVIRTGLKREGEKDIPVQDITVPLTYSVEGDAIKVARGRVKVSVKGGIGVAAVLRKRIQAAIPEERTREAIFTYERENLDDVPLRISNIAALNGWLSLTLQ